MATVSKVYEDLSGEILCGSALDALQSLPDKSVQLCITSPPYWQLRDYGIEGQIGLEPTIFEYISKLVIIFEEVRRVLTDSGVLVVNIADTYIGSGKNAGHENDAPGANWLPSGGQLTTIPKIPAGLKRKDQAAIPYRLVLALQAYGWYYRDDIIWFKPNAQGGSWNDRTVKAHEYVYLFSKSEIYYFDTNLIREPMASNDGRATGYRQSRECHYRSKRNEYTYRPTSWATGKDHRDQTGKHPRSEKSLKVDSDGLRKVRSVWAINTASCALEHFATFPEKLVEPFVIAGSRKGDTVLDCFSGVGTTLVVAKKLGRRFKGIELKPAYIDISEMLLAQEMLI